MAAVIALRPKTERGVEILDELEEKTEMDPQQVLEDGTRRYYLDTEDADVTAFDPVLVQIDMDWREHVEAWRD
jgi:hypothetical protein